MSDAIGRFVTIEPFRVATEFDRVRSRETAGDLFGRHEIFGRGINLDGVTGAEQLHLIATAVPQHAIGLGLAGKVLARFVVRVVMTQADAK